MSQLLNEREASEYLNMSCSFLKAARCRGNGPMFRKLSRSIRYLITDLDAWIEQSARRNTIHIKHAAESAAQKKLKVKRA
jgi:hypothetical protein